MKWVFCNQGQREVKKVGLWRGPGGQDGSARRFPLDWSRTRGNSRYVRCSARHSRRRCRTRESRNTSGRMSPSKRPLRNPAIFPD